MGPPKQRIIDALKQIKNPPTLLELRNKVNIQGGWDHFVTPEEFEAAIGELQAEGVIEMKATKGGRIIGNLVLLRQQE